jgi:hypothetical protein
MNLNFPFLAQGTRSGHRRSTLGSNSPGSRNKANRKIPICSGEVHRNGIVLIH